MTRRDNHGRAWRAVTLVRGHSLECFWRTKGALFGPNPPRPTRRPLPPAVALRAAQLRVGSIQVSLRLTTLIWRRTSRLPIGPNLHLKGQETWMDCPRQDELGSIVGGGKRKDSELVAEAPGQCFHRPCASCRVWPAVSEPVMTRARVSESRPASSFRPGHALRAAAGLRGRPVAGGARARPLDPRWPLALRVPGLH